MNQLMSFFLEMLLVSALFFAGYLLLKRHTGPSILRLYLLGWLCCSFLFPLVSIELESAPVSSVSILMEERKAPVPIELEYSDMAPNQSKLAIADQDQVEKSQSTKPIDWKWIAAISYLLVSVFFLLRILIASFQIFKLKARSKEVYVDGKVCYEVQKDSFKGASFFQWIFIGSAVNEGRGTVVNHELAHSKLFHSADILVSHLYCAILWANPLAWILKREIAINSELEADAHLLKSECKSTYANLLIDLSVNVPSVSIANHFSAFHLKTRIRAISNPARHKKWVPILFGLILLTSFVFVSCSKIDGTSEIGRIEKLSDVKSITTRFTSHQSDTQQKTGKIVAIATFLPDGSLDDFVEQTTYPYDFEFEKKKGFWEQPNTAMLPYIMDGLSIGTAEKSFLYGSDWPSAYGRYMKARSLKQTGDFFLKEEVTLDNEILPNRMDRKKDREQFKERMFIGFQMPDIVEYFEYEDGKIMEVSMESIYPEVEDETIKKLWTIVDNNLPDDKEELKEKLKERKLGKKEVTESYSYENGLLTSLVTGNYEYKFYYEEDLLIKSEYYKLGTLLNTRFHYYRDDLKDRTEIFNRYAELEYTINYEYEFWDN